jgi:hypothetical protein
MPIIEFTSQFQEGGVIKLPAEWQRWQGQSVRVILHFEDPEVSSLTANHQSLSKPPYSFQAVSLDTRGFRFNREEAKER